MAQHSIEEIRQALNETGHATAYGWEALEELYPNGNGRRNAINLNILIDAIAELGTLRQSVTDLSTEIEELRDIRDANFLEMSRLRGIAERYQDALPIVQELSAHHITVDSFCKFCMSSGQHQPYCPITKAQSLVRDAPTAPQEATR